MRLKEEPEDTVHNHRKRTIALLFGLVFLTAAVFFSSLDNQPTNWDDPAIFANPRYHGLTIAHVQDALEYHNAATFQPLRDISYMVDFSLWKSHLLLGLHLHNIILYLLAMMAGFFFLRELCKAFELDEYMSSFLCAAAMLIYAAHPVHVESVAWLYARKEPLFALFTFLSLWAFIKARLERTCALFAVSAGAFILAVLAKPTAIVIPGAMMFIDLAIMRKKKEPSALLARSLFSLPVIIFAAWQGIRLVLMMNTAAGIMPYHGGSFWTNLLAVSQIFIAYIKLTGFSVQYAPDYAIRLYASPHAWQAWIYVGLNLLLLASAVIAWIKGKFLFAFLIFWHYLFLLPVSNIIPISQTLADRYALLPSLSWCVLLGYGLARLRYLKMPSLGTLITPAFPKWLAWGLAGAIISGYSALSVRQNDVWQNAQTLWEHTLTVTPNSFPGSINLSILYINQKRYLEAERLCLNLLKNLPYENLASIGYLPMINLALAQAGMREYDHAIHNYQEIIRFAPGMRQAHLGLAHCYWQKGDYPKAYQSYQFILRHLRIDMPRTRADVLYRAGYAAWKLGRDEEALSLMDQACSIPDKTTALSHDLAAFYAMMGQKDRAEKCYRKSPSRAVQ